MKIPKKGALRNCNNWRGITLLSVPSKILAKLIIRRISEAVDQQLRKEQTGFRKGWGCTDQIFTLRNIIEQCTEWQRQLYINYVDFEKAFDNIHRESLWRILRVYGIPQQIVLVIKSYYNNFKCRVENSDFSFSVGTGVRQGCSICRRGFSTAAEQAATSGIASTKPGTLSECWTTCGSHLVQNQDQAKTVPKLRPY